MSDVKEYEIQPYIYQKDGTKLRVLTEYPVRDDRISGVAMSLTLDAKQKNGDRTGSDHEMEVVKIDNDYVLLSRRSTKDQSADGKLSMIAIEAICGTQDPKLINQILEQGDKLNATGLRRTNAEELSKTIIDVRNALEKTNQCVR